MARFIVTAQAAAQTVSFHPYARAPPLSGKGVQVIAEPSPKRNEPVSAVKSAASRGWPRTQTWTVAAIRFAACLRFITKWTRRRSREKTSIVSMSAPDIFTRYWTPAGKSVTDDYPPTHSPPRSRSP